jgi:hypothetical protein
MGSCISTPSIPSTSCESDKWSCNTCAKYNFKKHANNRCDYCYDKEKCKFCSRFTCRCIEFIRKCHNCEIELVSFYQYVYCPSCSKISPYLAEEWRKIGTTLYNSEIEEFWNQVMISPPRIENIDQFWKDKYNIEDPIDDIQQHEFWCIRQIQERKIPFQWTETIQKDILYYLKIYFEFRSVMSQDIQKYVAEYILKCNSLPCVSISDLFKNFKHFNPTWNTLYPTLIIKLKNLNDLLSVQTLIQTLTTQQWRDQILYSIYEETPSQSSELAAQSKLSPLQQHSPVNIIKLMIKQLNKTYVDQQLDLTSVCRKTLQRICRSQDLTTLSMIINDVKLVLPKKLLLNLLDDFIDHDGMRQLVTEHLSSREYKIKEELQPPPYVSSHNLTS